MANIWDPCGNFFEILNKDKLVCHKTNMASQRCKDLVITDEVNVVTHCGLENVDAIDGESQ